MIVAIFFVDAPGTFTPHTITGLLPPLLPWLWLGEHASSSSSSGSIMMHSRLELINYVVRHRGMWSFPVPLRLWAPLPLPPSIQLKKWLRRRNAQKAPQSNEII